MKSIEFIYESCLNIKTQYQFTKSCKLSRTKDIPFIAGSIIWAKLIERQLCAYLKRVEDVLGNDWTNHIDGQILKQHGESFKQQLNTQTLFEEWLFNVNTYLRSDIVNPNQIRN